MYDTINELIIGALHQYHEKDVDEARHVYDCEELGKYVSDFVNNRRVVKLEKFSHGRPFYYDCTFPDCTIDGHKPPPPRRPQAHSAYGNEGYCYCGAYNCREVWPTGRK